jgi:hypothetical protein
LQVLFLEKPHWLIVNLIVYLQRSKEKEEKKIPLDDPILHLSPQEVNLLHFGSHVNIICDSNDLTIIRRPPPYKYEGATNPATDYTVHNG